MDRGSTSSAAADSGTCSAATAAAAYRRGVLNSSCKRRRLASKDEEDNGEAPTYSFIGSPRKLNYEKNESETSDDSEDDDSINRDILQVRQESILRRLLRLNYEDGENHLLHTTSFAKLFEYVKDYDIVAERKTSDVALSWSEDDSKSDSTAEGVWKHRGSGYVKVRRSLWFLFAYFQPLISNMLVL